MWVEESEKSACLVVDGVRVLVTAGKKELVLNWSTNISRTAFCPQNSN